MSTTTEKSDSKYSQEEYAQAFETAKDALGYVAKFQTPPTPDVYEVWFRYVQGENEALRESLNYCINDAQSVSKSQMRHMYQAYFSATEAADENARISNKLADELGGLKSIVDEQLAASGAFDSTLGSAAENLSADSTPGEAKACIELAMSCTEEMQGHLKQVTSQLEVSQSHIDSMQETLAQSQKLLLIDPVTEVGNRRFFDVTMAQHFENECDPNRYYFLMMVDLDEFKEVNDTYGHSTGDRVLKYVATKIQAISAETSVARYGGDEFAIFLESDQPTAGRDLGEEIRAHFAKTNLKDDHVGATLDRVTTSIGVARLREGDDQQSWFDRADKLLYSAKQSGRNRVMVEHDRADVSGAGAR